MNERFSLEYTLPEIIENERVNKKLPLFFDPALEAEIKWPFRRMKLKRMMKLTHFPAQELVDAANFILERREAGEKISIPVWRDLSEGQAEKAQDVVLIPFMSKGELVRNILICPGSSGGRPNMMSVGMPLAAGLRESGCQAFVLNYRADMAAADMARAIRFIRANGVKLGVAEGKLTLLACGDACQAAVELYGQKAEIADETHRYDHISPYPDALWLMGPPEAVDNNMAGVKVWKDDGNQTAASWLSELTKKDS